MGFAGLVLQTQELRLREQASGCDWADLSTHQFVLNE